MVWSQRELPPWSWRLFPHFPWLRKHPRTSESLFSWHFHQRKLLLEHVLQHSPGCLKHLNNEISSRGFPLQDATTTHYQAIQVEGKWCKPCSFYFPFWVFCSWFFFNTFFPVSVGFLMLQPGPWWTADVNCFRLTGEPVPEHEGSRNKHALTLLSTAVLISEGYGGKISPYPIF